MLQFRLSPILLLTVCAAWAADPSALPEPAQKLALTADAIVVGRVGLTADSPRSKAGYAAVWVERALKGRLAEGRDIIWLERDGWPKFDREGEAPRVLLLLARDGSGFYRVKQDGQTHGVFPVSSADAPLVSDTAKVAGAFGAAGAQDSFSDGEINELIKKAAKGSRRTRDDAFARLLAAGDSARPQLLTSSGHSEREIAAVSRTLLPLTGGGPVVNGVRLLLEPGMLQMKAGDARTVTVHYANLTARDIRVVTGVGSRGDNLAASAAYELRQIGADRKTLSAPLATTLPKDYGVTDGKLAPLPVVKLAPAFSTLPLALELSVKKESVAGKEQLRLVFPYGYIDLPGAGRYSLRARFDCAGPRPDQEKLQQANYWHGGQLQSNELILEVQ